MNKLILITGGSASGKSHLASELAKYLGKKVVVLAQDSFYKSINLKQNFDHPNAFDFTLQNKIIKQLLTNCPITLPRYDFKVNKVIGEQKIKPNKYIIVEGLFTFFDPWLLKKADLKIYVDTPVDTSLARRIIRDVEFRNRDIHGIIERWLTQVKPAYQKYILPMKQEADVVIPWHKLNKRSIEVLGMSIKHTNS